MGGMAGRTTPGAITEEDTINLFTTLLDLNDTQKKQLGTILDSAVQAAVPIQEKLDQAKQSLFEAAKAGKSDAEIDKLAEEQATLSSQFVALQARSFAHVCGMLTGDQRAKVDSFLYRRLESLLASSKPVALN